MQRQTARDRKVSRTINARDRIQRRTPGVRQVFRQDTSALGALFERWMTPVFDWVFAFTRLGAMRRLYALGASFIIMWVGLALIAHPLSGRQGLVSQVVAALTAFDVLRHLLISVFAMWLALTLASFYLDDIFELEDTSIAQRFIRSAAFQGQYPQIVVRDGTVTENYRDSTIYRIGGPGMVDVHLENVALFEKIDGTAHVIGPTAQQFGVLDGFERLRSIIDLRDQFITLSVKGRTRDGIPVEARDVRLAYSIYRGGRIVGQIDQLPQPYPFSPQAVIDLVYKSGREPSANAMRGLIVGELSRFISQHTLSEFLSNAEAEPDHQDFVPRDQITDLFYDYAKEFSQRAEQRGVQLAWIGVGTWVTPSKIIPARHLEAWKLSSEARTLRSSEVLSRLREESRLSELLRQIDEIPTQFYTLSQQGLKPDQILRDLLLAYREKLRNARDLYAQAEQPVPPEIDAAIRHLTLMGAIRLGQTRQ